MDDTLLPTRRELKFVKGVLVNHKNLDANNFELFGRIGELETEPEHNKSNDSWVFPQLDIQLVRAYLGGSA